MVALSRGQIKRNAEGIDITVMSSVGMAKNWAPTWELVMGHKTGSIDDNAYAFAYGALLRLVPDDAWMWLEEQTNELNEVTLLCYCRPDKFCHTHLVALYAQYLLPAVFQCATNPPETITQTNWYIELAEA